MYESFAEVYDTFMDDVPYDAWARWLIRALREHGINDGLILDLGCGTGQITRRLADAGYDMIGVDGSEDMLGIALEDEDRNEDRSEDKRADADEAENGLPDNTACGAGKEISRKDILYLRQDMRSFELYGTVRAVISTCDSLNYITDADDLKKVFSLVNNYLDPGGLFLFDLSTVYHYQEICADHTFAESRDECSFIWENEYDPASGINEYDLTLFIQRADGLYERFFETHREKAWREETVRRLLEEAGLIYEKTLEAYTDRTPGAETERIMVCAREHGKTIV